MMDDGVPFTELRLNGKPLNNREKEMASRLEQIDNQNEHYEERAAIREYCGGYSREEAERLAKRDILKR